MKNIQVDFTPCVWECSRVALPIRSVAQADVCNERAQLQCWMCTSVAGILWAPRSFFFFFFIVFSLFFPLRRLPFVVYICFDIYKAIFQRNYRGSFFGVVCVSSINSGLIIFPVSDNVQKWSFKYQLFFKAILNMYFFNPKKSKKLKIELQKLIGNFRIETKTMNIKI